MARVLLLGESWFVYSVHQKGFDSFTTSEYTEDGDAFVTALTDAGHEVARIPAHRISTDLPATAKGIAAIADVVVVSDVGANTFLLGKDTFVRSIPGPDRILALSDFVTAGGGLLMVGGYLSFSGIDAKARWGRSPLAEVLPVTMLDRDDRIELQSGPGATVTGEHPITAGLDPEWPALLGINEVIARDGSTVLAEVAGHPLLVVGTAGAGRAAAFTSDLAPHWASPAFIAWEGYGALFARTVAWLDGEAV
ncbi:glutamine amidotransferase [Herbiconiux sp. YIM B11900]|uniref:glutamine amidotransferase n=1 Tax=Herbiconiux sp. YIM B11900 TaxID=3404131 RepID=UPI003F87DDBC